MVFFILKTYPKKQTIPPMRSWKTPWRACWPVGCDRNLLIIHCASGSNNVVIADSAGFMTAGPSTMANKKCGVDGCEIYENADLAKDKPGTGTNPVPGGVKIT